MIVPADIKQRVENKVADCIKIAESTYDRKFCMPHIIYKKRGGTAGTANDHTYTIDLNSVILMENLDHFIESTVVHEFAHLVDGIVNPHTRSGFGKRSVHGPTWKRIMRQFGIQKPQRCHSYDVTNAQTKQKNKYAYKCDCCGEILVLGPVRHRKQQIYGGYKHGPCGRARGSLTFVAHAGKVSYEIAAETKASTKQPVEKKTAPKKPKTVKHGKVTKATQARIIVRDLYGNGHGKDMTIQRIQDVLDMTKAGASTYFYNAKKFLGL